eukprot:gene15161-32147_t
MNETVTVGDSDLAADPLFLEAEKLGIDARPQRGDDKKKERSLLFSFFGEDPPSVPSSTTATTGANGIVSQGSAIAAGKTDVVVTSTSTSTSSIKVNKNSKVANKTDTEGKSSMKVNDVNYCGLLDVLSIAKLFCRTESVEVLTEAWRNGREKLAVDYKRKKKEARKRRVAGGAMFDTSSKGTDKRLFDENTGGGGGGKRRKFGN